MAVLRTIRRCLNVNCRHGASAHKWRTYQYLPYKAECEHCGCERYQDPMIDEAAIARAETEQRVRNRAQVVPHPLPLKNFISDDMRRDYWREKQRESRARKRLGIDRSATTMTPKPPTPSQCRNCGSQQYDASEQCWHCEDAHRELLMRLDRNGDRAVAWWVVMSWALHGRVGRGLERRWWIG